MISLDKTKDICNIYYIYNKIGLGKELIDEYISPKKIISSDVTVGIVTAKFPTAQGVEVVLNNLTPAKIKKYLLATASAFPVFQICKIDGESYIDGGYYDNLPINFALDLGLKRQNSTNNN